MIEKSKEKSTNGSEVICKLPEVRSVTSLSKASIYRLMADGNFPKQCRLGKRAVGWKKSEINNWLNNLEEV